jgi:addiction module RelE/StbE family toxin
MAESTKTYTVNITQNAEDDLDEIILYIAQDNPQTALKILDKLQKRILSLKNFPERGRWVPELLDKNIKDYRELIESPWRIIYRIDDNDIYILMVIDGRRNVGDILMKKLMDRNLDG